MVKLVSNDEKTNLVDGNTVVGYIDNDILYGFGSDTYAVEIGRIDGRDVEKMFKEWKAKR